MQTFLPLADWREGCFCLDTKRLGKQRVEAMQILDVLVNNKPAWRNHPATVMWRGYERALLEYLKHVCYVWRLYGYRDSVGYRTWGTLEELPLIIPPWMGDERLHSSHRAALLSKNNKWYGQFGWKEEPRVEYYWPKGRRV